MVNNLVSKHQIGLIPYLCWNTVPSSSSRKRKNSSLANLNSQDRKRLACQLMNDVTSNSNSVDLRSTSDSAESSEFLLDHPSSRSHHDDHASPQNRESNDSQSNKTNQPELLKRITLPSEEFIKFV
ncbi:hypothetical protein H4Q26_007863 [Puccinia striiformis f. sp. tritici PST-130]|nr:hypothetical protein H4Q26_007863 [Puccinia striiformis f. sp. tritici PST-130]